LESQYVQVECTWLFYALMLLTFRRYPGYLMYDCCAHGTMNREFSQISPGREPWDVRLRGLEDRDLGVVKYVLCWRSKVFQSDKARPYCLSVVGLFWLAGSAKCDISWGRRQWASL
jgi:hypothetical protein